MFDVLSLLAQSTPLLPAAGGDYQGWVSIGTIAAGVAAFWRWISPRLDKVFDTIPKLQQLCERNTESLEQLAAASGIQANNFGMLSRLVSASQAAGMQCKKVVLLVEDSLLESRLVRGICADIIAKHKLTFIDVCTLEDALPHIPHARVVILDVTLPDSDLRAAQSLSQICPCPVIIHSANEYTPKDFPQAYAVLTKGTGAEQIRDALELAITDSRR